MNKIKEKLKSEIMCTYEDKFIANLSVSNAINGKEKKIQEKNGKRKIRYKSLFISLLSRFWKRNSGVQNIFLVNSHF